MRLAGGPGVPTPGRVRAPQQPTYRLPLSPSGMPQGRMRHPTYRLPLSQPGVPPVADAHPNTPPATRR